MTLNDEGTGNGLLIVPETYGMGVPSACTIVIIAGKIEISGQDTKKYPSC